MKYHNQGNQWSAVKINAGDSAYFELNNNGLAKLAVQAGVGCGAIISSDDNVFNYPPVTVSANSTVTFPSFLMSWPAFPPLQRHGVKITCTSGFVTVNP
ncbi:hypothetical protein [Bradyrhizobium cosmicum]|uniref:hypothetical protein n=1 Tax=Bradyrhizobium cosmicum TaxID=1404864 RepID=UPI0028E7B448|nr:hypothetical protein [Bradyrhizobium cosmicum]